MDELSPSKSGLTQPLLVGDWVFEPSMNRLTRDGESAQLQPRVTEVLVFLASRDGEVATRQEILDAVWRREFVADNSVSQAVTDLRHALGDDARQPRYIETIPKRGYRLIAEVGLDTGGDGRPPSSTTARRLFPTVAGFILLLTIAGIGWVLRTEHSAHHGTGGPTARPRIVVLPFETIGPEERDYFAAGLTEEITCRLARAPNLHVISRTTAVHYGRAGLPIDEIGRELEVDYVLEGSVRWEEDESGEERVRVTPQLIRVADDSHLWTDSFDRALVSAFAVQAEIGAQVLEQLGINIPVVETGTEMGSLPPDPAAYDAFLHATATNNSESPARYLTAISWYRRAVEADPSYLAAWAGLARSCCLAYYFRSERTEVMQEEAREAAARAAEIEPGGEAAQMARGDVLYFFDRNYEAAGNAYRSAYAISTDPAILIDVARVERRLGDFDAALTTLTSALQRSPLSSAVMVDIGATCLYLRRYDEALVWFDRVRERNPASMMHLYMAAEALELRDGNAIEARRVLDEIPEPRGDFWWSRRFRYEYRDRRFEQALVCSEQVSEAADSSPPRALLESLALARLDRDSLSPEAARRAAEVLDSRLEADPGDLEPRMWRALARSLAGDHRRAIEEALRVVTQVPMRKDALLGGDLAYLLAVVACNSGDSDLAIETLEALLATPSLVSVASLRGDPMLDAISDDPRFEALLTR